MYDGARSSMIREVPPIDELIRRVRSGDRSAVEQLSRWYRPLLERWVLRRLGKRQPGILRPSDIAQEAASKAFDAFSSFKGATEGELVSWLQSIAETCTLESFRHAERKKRDNSGETPVDEVEIPSPQASPSQATATAEQWHRLLSQIYGLSEDQREAIWLHYLNDLRFAEVATRMNKTQAAVTGLVHRGIWTLRARLTSAPDPETPAARPQQTTPVEDAAGAALLVYLRRRDEGGALDLEGFIAEHPSCAEELRAMLSPIAQIEALRQARGNP
jgi:RNA polymerase sigma-70 factor, ECF subfamily